MGKGRGQSALERDSPQKSKKKSALGGKEKAKDRKNKETRPETPGERGAGWSGKWEPTKLKSENKNQRRGTSLKPKSPGSAGQPKFIPQRGGKTRGEKKGKKKKNKISRFNLGREPVINEKRKERDLPGGLSNQRPRILWKGERGEKETKSSQKRAEKKKSPRFHCGWPSFSLGQRWGKRGRTRITQFGYGRAFDG